jgi:hypothetical protein
VEFLIALLSLDRSTFYCSILSYSIEKSRPNGRLFSIAGACSEPLQMAPAIVKAAFWMGAGEDAASDSFRVTLTGLNYSLTPAGPISNKLNPPLSGQRTP